MSANIPRIDIKEFRELGYLQELNRLFLHPRGLALEVVLEEDGSEHLGGVWDSRGDPEGYAFTNAPDPDKAERVDAEYRRHQAARRMLLGDVIQQVGQACPDTLPVDPTHPCPRCGAPGIEICLGCGSPTRAQKPEILQRKLRHILSTGLRMSGRYGLYLLGLLHCDAGMRRHLAYADYVLRHKWYVFLACLDLQVPLFQALLHDWTKFLPVEWMPYAHHFYNADGTRRPKTRDATGAYDPAAQELAFQRAWLHHQRARHHWQAWVVLGDAGSTTILPMPLPYIREMIADWVGAGRAISGRRDPTPWYQANKDKMQLHPITRCTVETLLTFDFSPLESR